MDRPQQLRVEYHRRLEDIDAKVIRLFALVTEGIVAATEALLADDRAAAARVDDGEAEIDALMIELEDRLEQMLALEAPVAGELRYALCIIRIVPELERSGDLAQHIAHRAGTGLAPALTPNARGIVASMSELVAGLWRSAADAFADRDPEAHGRLDRTDDEVDRLHGALTAELGDAAIVGTVAAETALLARFYERLGDHAVHIAERVRWSVLGRQAG